MRKKILSCFGSRAAKIAVYEERSKPPLKGILKKPTNKFKDTQKKRDAFMELLAKRYPHYAEKIKDTVSEDNFPIRTPRPRDERRRTAVVTYNPSLNRSVEYDENGTMSDIDTLSAGNFQRGHQLRSSLPIVRPSSSTFERPLGLVFLVYKDETKKAALPNEVTTLDTVRALFVRSFPDKLTMQFMESPKNKIYIVDPRTNIYYQLEDLRDIKDRTVLKVHECDSDQPQVVKQRPEVRGKTIVPPAQNRSLSGSMSVAESPHQQSVGKSKSLPPQTSAAYQQMLNENQCSRMTERPRSTTPTMDVRGQAGIIPRQVANRRYSPERQVTPDRPPLLGTIPENRQLLHGRNSQNGYPISSEISPIPPYNPGYWPVDHPYQHPGDGNKVISPNRHSLTFAPMTPIPGAVPLENTPVNTLQRTQSYRVSSEREPIHEPVRSLTPQPGQDSETKVRMERMEAQLANLTAWVHNTVIPSRSQDTSSRTSSIHSNSSTVSDSTYTGSAASKSCISWPSGLSDIPSAAQHGFQGTVQSQKPQSPMYNNSSNSSNPNQPPIFGPNTRTRMILIKRKLEEIKSDFKNMQVLHQKNTEAGQAMFLDSAKKIMSVLDRVSFTVSIQPVRKQRHDVDVNYTNFIKEEQRIDNELTKLENSVEEVRTDVISKQCRVNSTDVEKMALTLSQLSKCIAEQKNRFPNLSEDMKSIMSAEMDIVVQEEKFLKEQPERLDTALRRCKKLTGTLFTLKRLALVQEHSPSWTQTKTTPKAPTTALRLSLCPNNRQEPVTNSDLIQPEQASTSQLTSEPGPSTQAIHNTLPANVVTPHSDSSSKSYTGGDGDETSLSNCLSDKTAKKTGENQMTRLPNSIDVRTVEIEDAKNKAFLVQNSNHTLSFTSTPIGHSQNIVTKPIAKKADITKPLTSGHNFVLSAKKVTGSPEKPHTSAMSSVNNGKSSDLMNLDNNTDSNTKTSLLNLACNKNLARADFFRNMLPPQGYQVINSIQPSTPTTSLDYTVRISPLRTTLFTNPTSTSVTSITGSHLKPTMSTAVAVAEIRPRQNPPPTPMKPSHLWKGNNSNGTAIVSNNKQAINGGGAAAGGGAESTVSPPILTAFSPINTTSNITPQSLSNSSLPSTHTSKEPGSAKPHGAKTVAVSATKKVPPPPPPRKSSKPSGSAGASPNDSPISTKSPEQSEEALDVESRANAKNGSPQFVQYTITTHQSKPSMLHIQRNFTPGPQCPMAPVTSTAIHSDNSPSTESTGSAESFSSSGSQQSVILKDYSNHQNGIGICKRTRPEPPQRTTSQLTSHTTVTSVQPVSKNTVFNGIKRTPSLNAKGDEIQETDID